MTVSRRVEDVPSPSGRVVGPWARSGGNDASGGPLAAVDPARVLLERMAEGDHDALAGLYDLTIGPAWRLALAVTGDARRAEVAVREAYGRVWRSTAEHLRASTSRLSPTAWVCQLVVEAAG